MSIPKMQVMVISPKVAESLLEGNTNNRHISWNHVTSLAEAMKRGEWRLTHQPIAVSQTGRLLDGQHRLWAVIESQVSIESFVANNVDESTFDCLDIGKKRSVTDVLGGDKRVVETVTAIARIYHGTAGITPQYVKTFMQVFADLAIELYQCAPSNSRGLTSAPVRAAAVVRMLNGTHKDYAKEQYRAMSTRDYTSMSPIVQSLVRQIELKKMRIDYWDLTSRAYHAFSATHKDTGKLQIKNTAVHIEEIRKTIRNALNVEKTA